MMLIPCPYCKERDENEFMYGGDAHKIRPHDPDKLSDQEWTDYLYMKNNPKDFFVEQWFHKKGCKLWFKIVRHTVTHEILGSYPIHEKILDLNHE
ncbi:MAG: sarcosine oxidase subunit delta [Alphaproteobacteria bacterium]|nr:sarcosine oxidase subunit delta [Alphaproteobacteria bacterium]